MDMVSLLFKQKVFSWFDSYNIFYENGDIAFTVKGQMAWGHLLNIYDPQGNKLGYIKEKVVTMLPKFNLFVNEQHVGTISRKFTMFKPAYTIDFNNWEIKGDIMGWDYDAYCGSELVMQARKQLFKLSDTYEIDVMQPENTLYALMVVLAIDAANCSSK